MDIQLASFPKGKHRYRLVPKIVDGRTTAAKRFKSLLADYVSRAKTPPLMTEERLSSLRTSVTCGLPIEKIEASFIAGKRKELGQDYIRLTRLRRQSLDHGLRGRQHVDDPEDLELEEYLAKKARAEQRKHPKRLKLNQENEDD